MKYHTQTELYIEGKQQGNCYPTVLACLLDLEINKVPNFQLLYWNYEEIANFNVSLNDWLIRNKDASKEIKDEIRRTSKSTFDSLWSLVKDYWLASRGYKEEWIQDINLWLKNNKNVPYMVTGESKRGVNHVVIYMNGKMIHDPHPSKDGVFGNLTYDYLRKLK